MLYPTLGSKRLDEEPFRTNYALLRPCLLHAQLLVVVGSTMRDVELNALIRSCLDENPALYMVVCGPEVLSTDVAKRIGCAPDRVAGAVGCFEIEEPGVLKQGRSRALNMIRLWYGSRPGAASSPPQQFGTDVGF